MFKYLLEIYLLPFLPKALRGILIPGSQYQSITEVLKEIREHILQNPGSVLRLTEKSSEIQWEAWEVMSVKKSRLWVIRESQLKRLTDNVEGELKRSIYRNLLDTSLGRQRLTEAIQREGFPGFF